MKTGDILFWNTDRATGHKWRNKYHVYICEVGWRDQGHAFLFINKTNYGGDYEVLKKDYPFFDLNESFVGCGGIVTYTDAELVGYAPEYKGALSNLHLRELYDFIAQSETLERWQIQLLCDALKKFL